MGKVITISYTSIPILDPLTNQLVDEIFRPLVPVSISYNKKQVLNLYDALIDSGSDVNLFPAVLGEMVGIDFKKAKLKILTGIGNSKITVFNAKVDIWVSGYRFETVADFSYQQEDLLLGRRGFFNLFKNIVFDENKKFVTLHLN